MLIQVDQTSPYFDNNQKPIISAFARILTEVRFLTLSNDYHKQASRNEECGIRDQWGDWVGN